MITYVNTVLISNRATKNILTAAPTELSSNTVSAQAGSFILMNCDASATAANLYNPTAGVKAFKIGVVTKKNVVKVNPSTNAVTYCPIVKWSNVIKVDDVKAYNTNSYTAHVSDVKEDQTVIDFTGISSALLTEFKKGGKRIIVRLTFKDLPNRFRKWTESYEYVTPVDASLDATKIANDIALMINKEYKRARVTASASSGVLTLVAMPYDDDNSADSINLAAKVRFNVNIYYTDPAAEGWESLNKHFPTGVTITKTPGVQYAAEAKLVRDREAQAMGYEGILNRGEGTWPIVKPDMETNITANYDGIVLEFENMYRAADDIFRKTKQTVEIYGISGQLDTLSTKIKTLIPAGAVISDEI